MRRFYNRLHDACRCLLALEVAQVCRAKVDERFYRLAVKAGGAVYNCSSAFLATSPQ